MPHYGTQMRTGISALHLNRPSQSFYNNSAPMTVNWVLNHDMVIPTFGKWFLLPSIIFMHQNPATEMVVYNGFRLNSTKNEYQQFGAGFRFVGNYVSPINYDALYFTYKLGLNNWNIGFSYDANISTLNVATSTIGAFEISIIYYASPFSKPRPKHHQSKNKCPEVTPPGKKKIMF